ncbi:MAG: hypothetical protein ACP5I3_11385 [Thermoproteus sp.]
MIRAALRRIGGSAAAVTAAVAVVSAGLGLDWGLAASLTAAAGLAALRSKSLAGRECPGHVAASALFLFLAFALAASAVAVPSALAAVRWAAAASVSAYYALHDRPCKLWEPS